MGSPASRNSTKWMPLTTRPSLTSRHGMMRLASMIENLQGLRQFHKSLVQSLSNNHSVEPGMPHRGKCANVVNLRDAARRNNMHSCAFDHLLECWKVRADKNTIPRYVRI